MLNALAFEIDSTLNISASISSSKMTSSLDRIKFTDGGAVQHHHHHRDHQLLQQGSHSLVWSHFLWRNHSNWPECQTIQVWFLCFFSHGDPMDSSKMRIQEVYPERVDHLPIQLGFSVLYFIIWLSAICGNVAVLYVVTLKHVCVQPIYFPFLEKNWKTSIAYFP